MSYRKKHTPAKPEQQIHFPPPEVEYSNPDVIYTGMTYEDEAATYASPKSDVLVLAVAPWA